MKRSPIKRSKPKPTHYTKDGRLILSLRDWLKQKKWLWEVWHIQRGETIYPPRCAICGDFICGYENFEPDHIIPRGMGGGTRDDRPENLRPSHSLCNRERGSKRVQILDVT